MKSDGARLPSVLLALLGFTMILAAAGTEFLGIGTPGLGRAQLALAAGGFGLLAAAHGLGGRAADHTLAESLPIALVALSLFVMAATAWFAKEPPRNEERVRFEATIGERLLSVERLARTPRRGPSRCYPPAGDSLPGRLSLVPVVTGLSKPVYASPAGDGSGRLFVVEKGGTIRVVVSGRLVETPFLDIRDRVLSDDRGGESAEQGLLSVAFPPDFATSGRFYVQYTAMPAGTVTISRFRVGRDPDRADPRSEEVVLSVSTVGPDHNGGQLSFGPDGYLYASIGDGGGERWPTGDPSIYGDGAVEGYEDIIIPPGSGFGIYDRIREDPWEQGQDLTSLRATIIRIDVSADSAYGIPTDNPFVGDENGARGEIWAYGLRNPWRISFDPCDGALFVADVGSTEFEEINLIEPGGNYGWSRMEGGACFPPWSGHRCVTVGLRFPISAYRHLRVDPSGGQAVIGGYVYRGTLIPRLVGRYVFGDFMSSRLWALSPTSRSATGWRRDLLMSLSFLPTSFAVDSNGELLVVGYGGTVYRLVEGPRA